MQRIKDELQHFRYTHRGLVACAKTITCIIFYPITCGWFCRNCPKYSGKRNSKKIRRDEKIAAIQFRRRVRAIQTAKRSPSMERNKKGKDLMNKQINCALLQKLPVEVRIMIYELVLCQTRKAHVLLDYQSPTSLPEKGPPSYVCRIQSDEISAWHDECIDIGHDGSPNRNIRGERQRLLSFLLTCRKVYSEAINILYSHTNFIFHVPLAFRIFAALTLPKRMNRIRDLQIRYTNTELTHRKYDRYLPRDDSGNHLCEILASMECLQSVVFIYGGGYPHPCYEAPLERFARVAYKSRSKRYRTWLYVNARWKNVGPWEIFEDVEWIILDETSEQPMLWRWPLRSKIPVEDGFLEKWGLPSDA